jgi:hypothetical protein
MASAAQIAANIRNAKKSTGPKTLVTKNRSRLNSLKHGMAASVTLLPDEDVKAFKDRMIGWIDALEPRNRIELFLAERAVYLSWQLDRVSRAQSAALVLKALTAAEDRENRVTKEVADLTQRLFRIPRGRLADHARAESRQARQGDSWPGVFDDADHPARLVGQLESTGAGCQWLLDRWNDLGEILEKGRIWRGTDRFKAMRLLRVHPIDVLDTPELTELLQACQVLDPHAGDLVNDLWKGLVSADAARSFEQLFAGRNDRPEPLDEASARQYLLKVVKREMSKLEAKVKRHQERDQLEVSLAEHRLAFDASSEGESLRRCENSCNEFLFRILGDLTKRSAEKGDRPAASYAGSRTLFPTWLEHPAPAIDLPRMIDRFGPADTRSVSDRPGAEAAADRRSSSRCEPKVKSEPTRRHAATAAGTLKSQCKKGSRVVPEYPRKVTNATERILHDEAMAAILAGPQHEGRTEKIRPGSVREYRATRRARRGREKNAINPDGHLAPNLMPLNGPGVIAGM